MFYNISFMAENRVAFFNRIKNNDYDCVIMPHDQFCNLRLPIVVATLTTLLRFLLETLVTWIV